MPRLGRTLVVLAIVGVAIFAGVSIYADVGKLGDRLGELPAGPVVLALLLALANYLIRLLRWELYLRRSQIAVPRWTSALVFFSGFAMSVTPGKVGELFKAALLREAAGVPASRTAPVVVAERVTDLVSVVLLALVGVAAYGIAGPMVVAGAIVVAFGLVALAYRPLGHALLRLLVRLPGGRKIGPRLGEMYDTLAGLVRPAPLTLATFLGVVAWLCECLGFALLVRAFPGAYVSLGLATLIYAATTLAGALSFLPGGLVVTEASMVLLLVHSAQGLDEPTAVAATIVTRLCTLWFAVVLGLLALAVLRHLVPRRSAA